MGPQNKRIALRERFNEAVVRIRAALAAEDRRAKAYPVSEEYCKQIGADAYTPDAASAADKAVEFCA